LPTAAVLTIYRISTKASAHDSMRRLVNGVMSLESLNERSSA
jgi:hypothetical protein